MTQITAGVIGLGVGHQHLKALKRSTYVSDIYIHDFNAKTLNDYGMNYDVVSLDSFDKIIDASPDLIVIASYDNYHSEQVIAALQNNINVFVEKPLCLTREELKDIEAAYKSSTARLSTNFILRKEQRFVCLRKVIEDGKLGEIYQIDASYDYGRFHKVEEGWRGDIPYYSVFLGGGIHMVDLCQWLVGEEFNPEFSLGTSYGVTGSDKLTQSVRYDNVVSLGKFQNGAIGRISSNYTSQTKHYHQLRIYGTGGVYSHEFGNGFYSFGNDLNNKIVHDFSGFPSTDKGDFLLSFIKSLLGLEAEFVPANEVFQVMDSALKVEELLCKM